MVIHHLYNKIEQISEFIYDRTDIFPKINQKYHIIYRIFSNRLAFLNTIDIKKNNGSRIFYRFDERGNLTSKESVDACEFGIYIDYYPGTNKIHKLQYTYKNNLHNTSGPAVIDYYKESIVGVSWWHYGQWITSLKDAKDCKDKLLYLNYVKWYKDIYPEEYTAILKQESKHMFD